MRVLLTEYVVRFGSVRAPILRSNMRMRNGMLHIIDATLYSEDPNASEWSGGSQRSASVTALVLALVCSCYVTFVGSR